MDNLPTWTTQQEVEGTGYMTFSDRLEFLDNNNWEKSHYMKLITDILWEDWMSALDRNIIENAIYSYAEAR